MSLQPKYIIAGVLVTACVLLLLAFLAKSPHSVGPISPLAIDNGWTDSDRTTLYNTLRSNDPDSDMVTCMTDAITNMIKYDTYINLPDFTDQTVSFAKETVQTFANDQCVGVKGQWSRSFKKDVVQLEIMNYTPEGPPAGVTVNNIDCIMDRMEELYDPLSIKQHLENDGLPFLVTNLIPWDALIKSC